MNNSKEIKNQELYISMYKRLKEEGFIYRSEFASIFKVTTNNVDYVLTNFDNLGLFVYEDEEIIQKKKKHITKQHPNKFYSKTRVYPVAPDWKN